MQKAGRTIDREGEIIPPCSRRFSLERRGNHKVRKWQLLYLRGGKVYPSVMGLSRINLSRKGRDRGDFVLQGEAGPQAGHPDRRHHTQ
jgi:hypothetical protein